MSIIWLAFIVGVVCEHTDARGYTLFSVMINKIDNKLVKASSMVSLEAQMDVVWYFLL